MMTEFPAHVLPLYGQPGVVHRGRVGGGSGSPLIVIIAQGYVQKSLKGDGKTPPRNMP